ncbi:Erythronate-4-phosphate dehydrogenase [Chitinispirillum alkaliphilum]|nr:Erythronate-4-phosphate dehydrogenase [Chitinispirillum alkaliphilum]
MNIIADQNILFAAESFAELGEVTVLPSYKINREELKKADIALVRSVTPVGKELLEDTPVRFVASATIGIDHVDLDYLRERSIGFAHAPGSNADSVAEYVLASILETTGKTASELSGLKIAIIGVGNVGSKVCRIATSLGMECLLYDPPKKQLTGSGIYLPLEQVLSEADIITLHVPLEMSEPYSTYHMVNKDFMSMIKNKPILINTSRGKVIDEKEFRQSRDCFGPVVFDVWDNEPSINTETVRMVDIATPHIAGYSFDGKVRGTEMIQSSTCAFFFQKQNWFVDKEQISNICETLDLSESGDPVTDAVRSAYQIKKDDEQFRAIFSVSKEMQHSFFEEFRKNYHRRYEFPHFLTLLSEKQKEEMEILSQLRFPAELKSGVDDTVESVSST